MQSTAKLESDAPPKRSGNHFPDDNSPISEIGVRALRPDLRPALRPDSQPEIQAEIQAEIQPEIQAVFRSRFSKLFDPSQDAPPIALGTMPIANGTNNQLKNSDLLLSIFDRIGAPQIMPAAIKPRQSLRSMLSDLSRRQEGPK